jgi:hypothetical protein
MGDLEFKQLVYPEYSLYITPSDFFLFACVKQQLRGQEFDSPQDLQEAIRNILNGDLSSIFKKCL